MGSSLSKVFKQAGLVTYGAAPKAGGSKPIRKEPDIPKLDKLRTAARKYPCVMCGRDKRFTVAAHCNEVAEKGIGKTSADFMLAYLCNTADGCHAQVDGKAGGLKKAEKRAMWNEAHRRTVAIWFRDRMVVLA